MKIFQGHLNLRYLRPRAGILKHFTLKSQNPRHLRLIVLCVPPMMPNACLKLQVEQMWPCALTYNHPDMIDWGTNLD